MKKINETQKVTLTLRQLKKLIEESIYGDSPLEKDALAYFQEIHKSIGDLSKAVDKLQKMIAWEFGIEDSTGNENYTSRDVIIKEVPEVGKLIVLCEQLLQAVYDAERIDFDKLRNKYGAEKTAPKA